MGRQVTEAQCGKGPVQRLADRVSAVFVPVVIMLALITLGAWLASSEGSAAAFTSAVAVLTMSWSTARTTSTGHAWRRMISIFRSARPWVCDGSGERFSV